MYIDGVTVLSQTIDKSDAIACITFFFFYCASTIFTIILAAIIIDNKNTISATPDSIERCHIEIENEDLKFDIFTSSITTIVFFVLMVATFIDIGKPVYIIEVADKYAYTKVVEKYDIKENVIDNIYIVKEK